MSINNVLKIEKRFSVFCLISVIYLVLGACSQANKGANSPADLKGCPACSMVQNYKASGKPRVEYRSQHDSVRGTYHSWKKRRSETERHHGDKEHQRKHRHRHHAHEAPPSPAETDPGVDVFLSNKHISKDCRRNHYGRLHANSSWGNGRMKRGRGQNHSHNEKPARHRHVGTLDKVTDLSLKPKAIEFFGKYREPILLDLKQPVVSFNSVLDEGEKKLAFGQLRPLAYEEVIVHFEEEGRALYEGHAIPVKTHRSIQAKLPASGSFSLKAGQHYDIRISVDMQESLHLHHGHLTFHPKDVQIDAIEEISMENIQVRDREVLFKISQSITEENLIALFENNKVDPYRMIPGVNYIQAFVREGTTTYEALTGILADPNVLQADFNYAIQGRGFTDEPGFAAQKDLWDQLELSEWTNSLPASPVKVGVLDTGIDPANPDINTAYSDFADPITGETNALDTSGHGTEIASIIAGRVNGVGIAGINPNVQIIPVKVLTGPGTGDYATLAHGIMYAAAKGAKVINLSLGGYSDVGILSETISLLTAQGIIFVAAAGNDATDIPVYPASYPDVISVASVNANKSFSSFSNFGETVDVSAPGEDIAATSLGGAAVRRSGTSYSAAIVSGLVASALAENPNLTLDQIEELIDRSSDFASRRYTTNSVGAGALNAKRFVRNLRNQTYNDVQLARIEPIQPSLILNQPSMVRYVVENRGTQIVPGITITSKGQDSPISPQVVSNLQPFERRELLSPYISRNYLDGLQSIESQLTFADENQSNNKKQVTLAVSKTAHNSLLLGRIKAVLVNSDGENLKFKVSIGVLNPTAYAVNNVSVSLAETTVAQEETPFGTTTIDTIAAGQQAFFHFFIEKTDTENAVFNMNLIARTVTGFGKQLTAFGNFEFNKASSGQIGAMHQERVHEGIADSVIQYYLPTYVGLPSSVIQEFGAFLQAIRDGECREDGDNCSDHDEYFHTIDPVYGVCEGLITPCMLISNMHFWRIDDGVADEKTQGVGTFAWLSSYYNSNGVPNAWQRGYALLTGQGVDGLGPTTGYISINQLYQSGQKAAAYRMLGHLMHLIQDMSMPVHAHGQQHMAPRDALESWEGKSGWDDWNGNWVLGAQRAKTFYDQHFRDSSSGLSNLLTIPQYLRGQTPTVAAQDPSVFPLFYLMSVTNARGGWFADYLNDGKNYSRAWTNWPRGLSKIGPMRLRSKAELKDNQEGLVRNILKVVCVLVLVAITVFVCSFWWIPWVGPALCLAAIAVTTTQYDNICDTVIDYVQIWPSYNDNDGDLTTIRDQTFPMAYLSTATMLCHFAEQTGQVTAGTCPQANTAADDPNQFSIGGAVLGLSGSVTLQESGFNTVISQNGNFKLPKFAVSGQAYSVTISTQPAGQTCTLINPTGTVGDRDILNIGVKCATIGDVTPPGDVSAFTILPSSAGSTCANVMSWANPNDADFFGGYIVRNESRVPLSTSDGVVVFQSNIPADNNLVPEGSPPAPTNFTDSTAEPGKFYYYKIFAQDTSGNFSNGVYQTVTTSSSCASGCPGGCGSGGSGGGGDAPCFIATAAFGESRELTIFRDFRSSVLMQSTWGKAVVSNYYKYSPPVAAFISEHGILRGIVAGFLKPLAATISVARTGGDKRDWLILAYYGFFFFGVPAMMILYRRRRFKDIFP